MRFHLALRSTTANALLEVVGRLPPLPESWTPGPHRTVGCSVQAFEQRGASNRALLQDVTGKNTRSRSFYSAA